MADNICEAEKTFYLKIKEKKVTRAIMYQGYRGTVEAMKYNYEQDRTQT